METNYTKPADRVLGIMPVVGLGTWEITGPECINSVITALNLGYRHLDTAQIYGNEKEVGKGIRLSGVPREDIFLTTKIATHNLTSYRIKTTARESLERLGTDYVDLLLIHWPTETMNLKECLKAMFELKNKGLVKHVGVSNFDADLFLESIGMGDILTNQVKFTPYHEEYDNLKVAIKHGKIITAYSPLARGRVTSEQVLIETGRKYGKTSSQVALRWLIQMKNVCVIPKASGEEHQKENIDIFDFQLSGEDVETISNLSRKPAWR